MAEHSAASSFAKGLAVLGWVIDNDGGRADELAAGLGMPLSSAYRFLRTLRERGFVVDVDGKFSAGPKLRSQPSGPSANRLTDLAGPFLKHLAQVSGESAVLTVRHGMHGVCVRQVESEQELRVVLNVGQLLPPYAGASQRALLAFSPEHVQRRVLESEMRSFTPNTPARSELPRLLTHIRAHRFATSKGELMTGSVSLAVPVLTGSEALCALGVAGPQNRCGTAWQAGSRRELDLASRSLAELVSGQD